MIGEFKMDRDQLAVIIDWYGPQSLDAAEKDVKNNPDYESQEKFTVGTYGVITKKKKVTLNEASQELINFANMLKQQANEFDSVVNSFEKESYKKR